MGIGKVVGKRLRGRRPTCWTDQIRATLDTTVHDALLSASDRNKWRWVIGGQEDNDAQRYGEV